MQLSNDLAALIGFACEAVLWGVNATLFIAAFVILRRRPTDENLCNLPIYLTSLIFLCCTTHFALEFNHFYTTLNAVGVNNYANETTQLSGADYLISFTDFLGILVLIYRCWLLWDNNYYIAVLPLITAVGGLASTTVVIILLYSIDPTSPAPPPVLVPVSLAAYTLPLCANVMVTSLIVLRIWVYSRGGGVRGVTRRAMMLVVESGALYLLFQLIFVVLVAAENAAEAIVAVMAVQIYGVAPTLIIIRVGLGVSSEQISGPRLSKSLKWSVHRSEASGTCVNNGLVSRSAIYEGAKKLGLSTPDKTQDDCELGDMDMAVRFEDTHKTEHFSPV